MSDFLPATERLMADLQRRVLDLETSQRVGLNRTRAVWGTASAVPTTFGAWETGATGCTWAGSDGSSGTGYGQLTVELNTLALVMFSAMIIRLADNPTGYRSRQVQVGLGLDGVTPPAVVAPVMYRQLANYNAQTIDAPTTYAIVKQFTKGSHTFTAQALWDDTYPAATYPPQMTDTMITVVPLD